MQIERVRAYPGTDCTAPTERGCRGGGGGRWVNSFLGKKKEGEQKEVVGGRGEGGVYRANRLSGDLLLHA